MKADHFLPQHRFTHDGERKKVDRIIKLEELDDLYGVLKEKGVI